MKVLLLTLALFMLACSEPGQDQEPSETRRYVHSMDGSPASLDPVQASNIYANFLVVNLYDTLYRYQYLARPYQLSPNLAAAMPTVSDDGLGLSIPIKRGVYFVDDPAFAGGKGREVTAFDFVYSLLRHFDPDMRGQGAWLWQGRIEGLDEWKASGANYDQPPAGLQATDRHTVRIRLTQPYPQLVHTLAQGYAAVVAREAVEFYGRQLASHAVGSGPFQLDKVDSARAVLKRNTGFRSEPVTLAAEGYQASAHGDLGLTVIEGRSPPFVDEVQIEFIAEDAARWNSFNAGQTQFIKVPAAQFGQVLASRDPPTLTPQLQERFHLQAAMESGFVYTLFNMADPSIGYHPDPEQASRNRALRCAIIKGFDWQSRNRAFFADIGRLFSGIIPPTTAEFDEQNHTVAQRDVAGARQLLSTHGWNAENLPVLEYGYPASVTERQMFEQFKSFMRDIGFPPEKIQARTFATFGDYVRAFSQRELMLITSSWTMDYPDAENTISLFYGPNSAPGSNFANFDDAQFNRLYEQASVLAPSPQRTALFQRMNQRVIDECVTISGLSRTLVMMWDRQAIMLPDRSFTGGYFLRFVEVNEPGAQ